MTNKPIATYDALRALGFVEDASLVSDDPGGLSFDFRNFKLDARHCANRLFAKIVLLSGVMTTRRTIAEVHGEMPQKVESIEQAAALVAYCLDKHSSGPFCPAVPVPWLEWGRQNRHLLPWVQQTAAYDTRPHCLVGRDWVRVALRELGAALSEVDDNAPVDFKFNGEILVIRCGQKTVAMPASGEAWKSQYRLCAGTLRELPKRLLRETVNWSVWESALSIANHRYQGVVALDAEG